MSHTVDDYLRHAKIDLMTKSVFLSTICLSLKHQFTDEIPTAGTNGLTILYNPDFFTGLSKSERTFVLAHEVWHVAFNHLIRVGDRDKILWNVAGDYVINDLLQQSGYSMIEGALYDRQYSDMSTEEVYEKIREEVENSPDGAGGYADFQPDLLQPQSKAEAEEVAEKTTEMLVKAKLQSEASKKSQGEIPGEIARAIDDLINPKLPWGQMLMQFLTKLAKDDYSWRRPNKRFFPHHYLPSQYSETLGEIVVAIDTSGSVTHEELIEMLSEVENIRDTFRPEKLTVIDCDWEIHNIHAVKQHDDILSLEFSGCGGTDFQPVIKHCNAVEPELLIYFTDLYANDVYDVGDYPIMWICNSDHPPANVGETIYINN